MEKSPPETQSRTKGDHEMTEHTPITYWLGRYDGGQFFDIFSSDKIGFVAKFRMRDEAEKFVKAVNSFEEREAELKEPKNSYEELLKAAKHFVWKVETGRAHSTESYNQFKKAIAKADGKVP